MQKIKDSTTGEEKHVPITTNPILTQRLTKITPKCGLGCALLFLSTIVIVLAVLGIPIIMQANDIIEYITDFTDW